LNRALRSERFRRRSVGALFCGWAVLFTVGGCHGVESPGSSPNETPSGGPPIPQEHSGEFALTTRIGSGRGEICWVGDVDGDGTRDFATGDSGGRFMVEKTVGRVSIHSGFDGHILREFRGADPGDEFGHCVRFVPKSPDGWGPLLIVSSPGARDGPRGAFLGRVSAYSLPDGALAWKIVADSAGGHFGDNIAVLPACRQGGTPLLAVCSPEIERDRGTRMGQVELRSAADGALRCKRLASPRTSPGIMWMWFQSMVACPDLDGDGIEDLAIGSAVDGLLEILGSRDLSLENSWAAGDGIRKSVEDLVLVGDVDGDGMQDLASLIFEKGMPRESRSALGPVPRAFIEVYSVARGSMIRRFGIEINPGGDLHRLLWNREAGELAVLDPQPGGASTWAGSVIFVDLSSARTMGVVTPPTGKVLSAMAPELLGDLDGDGVRDLGVVAMDRTDGLRCEALLISWKGAVVLGALEGESRAKVAPGPGPDPR